jgi:hypothetical protein
MCTLISLWSYESTSIRISTVEVHSGYHADFFPTADAAVVYMWFLKSSLADETNKTANLCSSSCKTQQRLKYSLARIRALRLVCTGEKVSVHHDQFDDSANSCAAFRQMNDDHFTSSLSPRRPTKGYKSGI